MTATQVLAELRRREIPIFVLDGRLRVRAGLLTDDLRAEVLAHREELVALLTVPVYACSACGRFAFPRPTVCYGCRRTTACGAA